MNIATRLVVLALTAASAAAQSQAPVVKTTTTGVVIDVTALDKDGKPVADLQPADFDLTEDGVRQEIASVTFVRGGVGESRSGRPPAQAAASDAPVPVAGTTPPSSAVTPAMPSVTAILFDRLSPEVRPLAGRAALAYVSTLVPPRDYAGVFLADVALKTFQPFTSTQDTLRSAVARAVSTAPSNLTTKSESFGSSRIQNLDPNQSPTVGAEVAGGYINALDREKKLTEGADSEKLLRQMELRMTESYHQFLAESEGQASLAGLRAVVKGLSVLPGRKSILYFTEALTVTDRLKSRFDILIGEANRANVSVFTVDAVGLRVHSKEAELGRNVEVAGAQGVGDARRGDGPYTKDLERQEQMLTSRPSAVLGRLAKETGGFLLENTNDLGAGVARMQQERTTYYLLAYQPTNPAQDGKFRRVAVKVKRPKVTVKSRAGYLAGPAERP
jgi:VWFA-related protein